MRVEIIEEFSKIPANGEKWNSMVEMNETNTIFLTYEWLSAWWEAFYANYTLYIICVYDNNELVGIAPLAFRKHRDQSDLVFIGDGNADYLDFIIIKNKQAVVSIILQTIYSNNYKWNNFYLRNIPEVSTTTGLIASSCKTLDIPYIENQRITCPTLLVKHREIHINNLLNKYSIKRPFNRLIKKGELEHHIFDNINDASSNLDEFFNQHIERWKLLTDESPFIMEKNKIFFKLLLNKLFPLNKVVFSAVKLDGTAIAYHFGFDYNNSILWYKPSFSPAYGKYSPGLVLVRYLIEHVLTNGKDELDFTIGNEAFKERFINIKRYNVSFRFFKSKRLLIISKIRVTIFRLIKLFIPN